MPGKVKVKVVAGRNLPVMNRSSDTSDAFVEVKISNTTYKTDVYRKSLNPYWNSDWFKFEMEDEELQDEPLQIRVMDYDTYSANDAIGKVYIDLNPLLLSRESGTLSGWIPIYDTMHGIRGEVNVIVKVELFSDLNRFRESSCGVKFFCGGGVPRGYRLGMIHGFVEELVVNDDPEYQWIDKIRTPRASNEARQTLFSKLSGEVQRKIGLKALELGGNSVVGYQQCFDLEGESGIVVRGIGTAVTLVRRFSDSAVHGSSPVKEVNRETHGTEEGHLPSSPDAFLNLKLSQSPVKHGITCVHKSSESDLITAQGLKGVNVTGTSTGSGNTASHRQQRRHVLAQDSIDMLEYPFLSMTQFPPGFIIHLGGVVSARSVKLLGRTNNPDESDTRDTWWTELRMEIRAHARALGSNVVLGYCEETSICDDVCLMSATGTAATVNLHRWGPGGNADRIETTEKVPGIIPSVEKDTYSLNESLSGVDELKSQSSCGVCHIPYSEASVPFPVNLVKCAVCRKSRVPDILFSTTEIPRNIPIVGKGCLVQARVCRQKKDAKGEMNAKEISDSLPFLEYDLHRQLLNKLKVKGMNALFGLRVQVSIGARMLVVVATSTGVYLAPLPPPRRPKLETVDETPLLEVQRRIYDTITRNCEIYGVRLADVARERLLPEKIEVVDSDDDLTELDLSCGNKDACVLEIDDSEVDDIVSLLVDPRVPDGFDVFNTEETVGLQNVVCNLQMFTRVWRSRIPTSGLNSRLLSQMCDSVTQSIFFKLRKMTPCALCNMQFFIDLPDDDEVQLVVLGTTVGLGDPGFHSRSAVVSHLGAKSKWKGTDNSGGSDAADSELLFKMEEEIRDDGSGLDRPKTGHYHNSKGSIDMPKATYHTSSLHHGIDISSLSYIPGARIDKYFGNLNFFFIRECTALRESGGLSGFMQSFVAEVFAIVRAHVATLGGNALISFFMEQCVLVHNPHKNQGQCLINVGGDVVSAVQQTSQSLPTWGKSGSPHAS